jgi:hypothetical protein
LDSRLLACGCLIGVYETYSGKTLSIVDARGAGCRDRKHRLNHVVSEQRLETEPQVKADRGPGCVTP